MRRVVCSLISRVLRARFGPRVSAAGVKEQTVISGIEAGHAPWKVMALSRVAIAIRARLGCRRVARLTVVGLLAIGIGHRGGARTRGRVVRALKRLFDEYSRRTKPGEVIRRTAENYSPTQTNCSEVDLIKMRRGESGQGRAE